MREAGIPNGLCRLRVLRPCEETRQDGIPEISELLLEEESFIVFEHGAEVPKKPQDVVHVVDVLLRALGKDDDVVEVHQEC